MSPKSSPVQKNIPKTIMYSLLLLAGILIMGWQSMYKGWGMFLVLPLLPCMVIIMVVAYTRMLKRLREGTALPGTELSVILQLLGAVLFYVCLPGTGDTTKVLLLGLKEADSHSALAKILSWAAFLGLATFVTATVGAFRVLGRASAPPNTEKIE